MHTDVPVLDGSDLWRLVRYGSLSLDTGFHTREGQAVPIPELDLEMPSLDALSSISSLHDEDDGSMASYDPGASVPLDIGSVDLDAGTVDLDVMALMPLAGSARVVQPAYRVAPAAGQPSSELQWRPKSAAARICMQMGLERMILISSRLELSLKRAAMRRWIAWTDILLQREADARVRFKNA